MAPRERTLSVGAKRRRDRAAGRSRHRWPWPLIGATAGIGLLVVGVAAMNSLSGAGERPVPYDIGQPGIGAMAPDFSLPRAEGGTFRLSDQRGKQVLLYFHEGLGCDPCWRQIDDIQADLAKFNAVGIDEVVAISIDPTSAQLGRAQRDSISLPVLADSDLTVSGLYGTLGYGMMNGTRPGHTFILVGPDGKIRWRADYGGPPNFTMYVADDALLSELRRALGA